MNFMRVALCVLSCLMTVAIVACQDMCEDTISTHVDHIDKQCMAQKYYYGCPNLNDPVKCENIYCAGPGPEWLGPAMDSAFPIGKAVDGTHCGDNKVCCRGKCIDWTRNTSMPIEDGDKDVQFNCYHESIWP